MKNSEPTAGPSAARSRPFRPRALGKFCKSTWQTIWENEGKRRAQFRALPPAAKVRALAAELAEMDRRIAPMAKRRRNGGIGDGGCKQNFACWKGANY
jgi:hypothetical protein